MVERSTIIPKSVIQYYDKYKNPGVNLKVQPMVGASFEMDDRYDIIDTSNTYIHSIHNNFLSWTRCLWCSCCSQRQKSKGR